MENRRLRLSAALALTALALGPGCGGGKARECNALSERINAGVARLEAHDQERLKRPEGGHLQTAQAMHQASELYREASAGVRAVAVSDTDLKLLADDYAASLQTASSSAELLSKALNGGSPATITTADSLYAESMTRQKKSVDKINAYCGR